MLTKVSDKQLQTICRLKNFRSLPASVQKKILSSKSRAEIYLRETTLFGNLTDDDATSRQIDALKDLVNLDNLPLEDRIAWWAQSLAFLLKHNSVAKTSTQIDFQAKINSILNDGLKLFGLNKLLQHFDGMDLVLPKDNEVITDSVSWLKKIAKLSDSKLVESDILVSSMLTFCKFAKVWLIVDPVVVADTLEDVYQMLKRMLGKKKFSAHDAEPLEFILDLLLKLLSNNSTFVKSLADGIFKPLIPLFTKNSVDIILEVLSTKSKDQNLLEEEDKDDDDDEEEEDISDVAGFTDILNNGIELNGEQEADSEEVYLDQADESELAMFDAKLSEIFQHKKAAKLLPKLSVQANVHFKARVIHWVRFMLDNKSGIPFAVRVHLLMGLVRSLPFNISNEDKSSNIMRSLCEIVKMACKQTPVNVVHSSSDHLEELFELLRLEYWENQNLWNVTQALQRFLVRTSDETAKKVLAINLQLCWSTLAGSKKMQKSNFAAFLSLWTDSYPAECWELVRTDGFFDIFASLNSHSRGLVTEYLRSLISTPQSSSEVTDQFALNLVKVLQQVLEEDKKGKFSKASQSLLSLLLKTVKKGKFSDETVQKLRDFSETLDANSKAPLKQAIQNLSKEN